MTDSSAAKTVRYPGGFMSTEIFDALPQEKQKQISTVATWLHHNTELEGEGPCVDGAVQILELLEIL